MYKNPCEHCENVDHCMHMMNMPMPEVEEDDDDLKRLYPKLYTGIYPMVRHHCDMMEARHGAMYCPSKEEMDHICEEICDMHEKHHKDDDDDDDDDDCKDDDMRQRRRRGRRRAVNDLVKILLIRDLLGRRRRHRRRPKYGYGYGY